MSKMPKSDNFMVGPVVLSYTDSLFEARSQEGGPLKFSCNIIYNETIRQTIDSVVEQIGQAAFGQDWHVPKRVARPVRGLAEKPQYTDQITILPQGSAYFSSISTQFEPKVLDANREPLTNVPDAFTGQKPIYGGVIAYVSINVYSYNHPKGGAGVSLGVSAVMRWQDGNPLVEQGSVDAQAAFAGAPAAPPPGALPPGQLPDPAAAAAAAQGYPGAPAPGGNPAYGGGAAVPAGAYPPAVPAYGAPAPAGAPAGAPPAYGTPPVAPAGYPPAGSPPLGQPSGPAPGAPPAYGAPAPGYPPAQAPAQAPAYGVPPVGPGNPVAGPGAPPAAPAVGAAGGFDPATGAYIPPIGG